jgi:anti-sigma B factor antagonist
MQIALKITTNKSANNQASSVGPIESGITLIYTLDIQEYMVNITIKEKADDSTLAFIKDEMTIYKVLEQKNELYPLLKPDHELQIDLSEVSEMDSSGLQLLIFLKKESRRIQSSLSLIHHSQGVVELIEHLNLSTFFGDPLVIPADWKNL